jgi:tRNA-2-methylthio-N6-dimethylallyladenosine synthase
MGDALVREVRGLGFVVGTERYGEIPAALDRAARGLRTVDTALDAPAAPAVRRREARLCEFVSVMRGCDNHCSYCIVPLVRGRERSVPASSVLDEARSLVALGAKEITLIGQNVNSYRDAGLGFAGLLRLVDAVPGVARVRFATSHPKDMSDDLIDSVAACERVCEHVHLPVQSGSDETLAAMNRRTTRDGYLALVRRIRERIPGVALTTDVIVGFPGETDERFRRTMSLLEEVRFDSAFMFRYSPRPGTAAAALPDDVPEPVKIERLEEVIRLQKRTTEEINAALVGSTHEVLVEGPSARDASMLFGRTRSGKATVFAGPRDLVGMLRRVTVRSATAWTLHGEIAERS